MEFTGFGAMETVAGDSIFFISIAFKGSARSIAADRSFSFNSATVIYEMWQFNFPLVSTRPSASRQFWMVACAASFGRLNTKSRVIFSFWLFAYSRQRSNLSTARHKLLRGRTCSTSICRRSSRNWSSTSQRIFLFPWSNGSTFSRLTFQSVLCDRV